MRWWTCPARHGRRTSGFTLIELLIVAGITGLLLALLYPVLGHVRATSRRTVCLSNLRQIGMGCTEYASTYNGWFPSARELGGMPKGQGAHDCAWFRVGPGQITPDDPAARPEIYGLAPLLDRLKILPGRCDVWICPAAASLIQSFGNTYAWLGDSLVGGGGKNDRRYYNPPRSHSREYLYDYFYDYPPPTSGKPCSMSTMGNPSREVPADRRLYPHRLNALTNEKGNKYASRNGVNAFFFDGHVALKAQAR